MDLNKLKSLLVCGLLTATLTAVAQQPAIIPLPNEMRTTAGSLPITAKTTISCADKSLVPAAEYLAATLRRSTGYRVPIVKANATIRLALAKGMRQGGYTLTANGKGVDIKGADYNGVVNAIATLRQLLPADIESRKTVNRRWSVPYVSISDAPRFQWRGMMLDCSRHFFSVDEIKQLIDVLSLYKIDRLHWHLTDDQGWRVEIKKYPLLTTKGGWRHFNNQDSVCIRRAAKEDQPALEIQPSKIRRAADGTHEYGGYYTQADIRTVVAYALQRGIETIPEIDMPGHSLMAINNYDGLSCFKQTGWGKTFSTPMCPGKESMLEFCKNVWSELFGLFPSKYVHIGGDEVEMANWKKCPDCQKRMRDNNLQTTQQLQTWFNHYMERFFNAHGKKMIGWDEIIDGGLSDNSTVMWWRTWSRKAPKNATSHGNDLICTPNTQCYLDYQEDAKSLPNIVAWNPMDGLTQAEQQHVLGVQGNMWTEWVPTVQRMWYQVFPRIIALAEKGWSRAGSMTLDGFRTRLVLHFGRLSTMGVTYRIPDLTGFHATNVFIGKGNIQLDCIDPSAVIRYTTDGTIPQPTSPRYDGNLTVTRDTEFCFRTFGSDGRKGDVFRAKYVNGTYKPAVNAAVAGNGLQCLWYDYDGNDCAGIDKAKLLREFATDGLLIPSECKDNIGLVFNGYIDVPADGIYTFCLLSDDGSWLKIDNDMIVDNDGAHSPREIVGQAALKKGLHKLTARYFDHNGGQLKLRVADNTGAVVSVKYAH